MAFCSRTTLVCKRYLHGDKQIRRTNTQLPPLPPAFIASDLYHVWPKHVHSGEISRDKVKGRVQEDDSRQRFNYIQNTFGGIFNFIKTSKFNPWLGDRGKNSGSTAKESRSKQASKQTAIKADKGILKKYQTSARMDAKEYAADYMLEKEKKKITRNVERVVDVKSSVDEKKDIEKTTLSLVSSLKYAATESTIIERTDKFIKHLVDNPEQRTIAEMDNAVDILRDLKRSCRQEVKEKINVALVLMGDIRPPKGEGVRLLTLDGGGMRGLCSIYMMQRIENEYNRQLRVVGVTKKKHIHEMFDYVCGTSTGSLLASLIFLFHLPLEQCRDLYIDLGKKMFGRDSWSKVKSMVTSFGMYDERLWENILRDAEFTDRTMMEFGAMSHVPMLSGISCIKNAEFPKRFLFRTYNVPPGIESRYPGSCSYKAQEMIRASSAAPTYYKHKELGNHVHVDGGMLANNPTAVAIHECRLLWPYRNIHCIISLGTGRHLDTHKAEVEEAEKRTFDINKMMLYSNVKLFYATLRHTITDTEEIHDLLSDVWSESNYFRFNPYLERGIELDSVDDESLQELEASTVKYMHSRKGRLNRAVSKLMTEKYAPLYADMVD